MVLGMQAPASRCEMSAAGHSTPRSLRRPSTLCFAGALDAFTVPDALRRIDAVVEGNPRQVVVDLANLELLDSAGVHALVTLHERVTERGGKVVVVAAHDQPLMVLELLNLHVVFGL
jgi:anti-sigma B factor antagonist